MTDRRSPSWASHSATVDNNNEASSDAALLSANRVYQHRASSIRSVSTSSVASNSARAAALRVGSHTPDYGFEASLPAMTDPSAGLVLPQAQRAQSRSPSYTTSLGLPPARRAQPLSPSHTAALVAAARASQPKGDAPTSRSTTTTTKKPLIAPKPRRLSITSLSANTTTINSPNDTSSIPSTPSLVSLFEQVSNDTSSKKQLDPIVIKPVKGLAIRSPKPHRPDGIHSVFKMEVGSAGRPPPSKQQDTGHRKAEVGILAQVEPGINGSQQLIRSAQDVNSNDSNYDRGSIGTSGRAATGRDEEGGQVHKVRNTTESKDFAPAGGESGPVRTSAQDRAIEPPRFLRTSPSGTSPTTILQPQRSQTSPIDIRPRPRPLSNYDNLSTSAQSTQSLSATYRQLYPKKTTPLTTDNELANAIVASSLASSRISTSQTREPPPVPASRRHSRHIFYSRTPSPVKAGLRQTLRKQESSDSDEEDTSHPFGKHQKKRLIRKHPNKHHEGDRKRWRDAVTETERKRYEGVWAANKGLFINPMPRDSDSRVDSDVLNDQVCNVVVKDIWSRSRLPDFELEAVWDLVDNDSIGRLSKEEFVVGMWLIDQRLKGRKLPVKVQPTVWASVRGIKGIKIRKQ